MQYDVANHVIKRNGNEYKLDPIINSLLQYLLANPNRLVSRKEINEHVWPNICVSDDAINRAVSVLRKSLSEERNKFLVTVRGEGYRFLNPDLIEIIDHSHPSEAHAQIANDVSSTQNTKTFKEKRWQSKIIGVLSVTCTLLLMVIWQDNLFSGDNQLSVSGFAMKTDPITIKINNFSSIGNKPLSADFDKNLVNELLMQLSISPNIDVTESTLNKEANPHDSHFHLTGTIDFKPNGAKVIVKLKDLMTSRLYPAIFFIKTSEDTSAEDIQNSIAKNVAATVRLKVLHGTIAANYETLLNKMTPVDIEKLYIARAELIRNETSAENGLLIIQELLAKYPEISEIKGAFAFAFNLSNINLWTYDELEQNIAMTQAVLSNAPNNYDALISLFYSYALHPHYRFKAFEVAQRLVTNYPDDLGAWYAQLYINTSSFLPCEKIYQNIVQSNAANVFPQPFSDTIRDILDACASQISHVQLDNKVLTKIEQLRNDNPHQAKQYQNAYYKLFAFFPLRVDTKLASDREHLRRAPRNSYRYNLLETLLMLDQNVTARSLLQQFEGTTANGWLLVSALLSEIEVTDQSPFNNLDKLNNDELIKHEVSALLPITTAVLIRRSQNWSPAQRQAYFSRLLESTPTYSMNLDSIEHSLAIIAAEYHADRFDQSRNNAQTLFGYLKKYSEQEPTAFQFWGLAKYQLLAGLYCGTECPDFTTERQTELLEKFYSDEVYWTHNRNTLAIYLSPFEKQESVQSYINRIEQDTKRAASELMF